MNVLGEKVTTFYYSPPFKAPLWEVSYRDLGELGKGGSSVVQKVESSLDSQSYALKIGRIGEASLSVGNEKCRKGFDQEVRMLTLLNEEGSEYVVQLIAFFILDKKPVLLLPFYSGDLRQAVNLVEGFSFGETLRITKKLLDILIFLKKHSVIHRDIKPENVFLTLNGDLRLGDFGLACLKEDSELKGPEGTGEYISPEQIKDPGNAGFLSDLWAVACVSFSVCSQKMLISLVNRTNRKEIGEKQVIAVNSLDQRLRKVFSEKQDKNLQEFKLVKDILKRMLVLNPQKRITAEEALTRLQKSDLALVPRGLISSSCRLS